MRYDIAIIGAGPAGLEAGYQLSKKGFKVVIIDRKKEIGKPVQCAGLVGQKVMELVGRGDYIISKITYAEVFSKSSSALVKGKEHAYSIDRASFDKYMANRALNAGSDLLLNSTAKDVKNKKVILRSSEIFADYIIIAEGAERRISRNLGIVRSFPIITGYELLIKPKNTIEEGVHIILDSELFPKFFGWVVPKGDLLLVGGGGLLSRDIIKHSVEFLAKKYGIRGIFGHYSGGIPLRPSLSVSKDNIFCVGDCAGQVKATTGGGIYMGVVFARALSEHIEDLHNNVRINREYIYRRKKELKELIIDYKIWKWYSSLNDSSYDRIITFLRENESLFGKVPYDYHSRAIFYGLFSKKKGLVLKEVVKLILSLASPF